MTRRRGCPCYNLGVPFASANCNKLSPLVAALLLLLGACGSNQLVEETVDYVYPIEPDANITIQNSDGAVQVFGSNADELRVRAVKKAYSRERLSQIKIEVSSAPGRASIITKLLPQPHRVLSDRSGTVDWTITVPAAANISLLDLHAGEVRLDGLHGRAACVRLGDGRLFARNCFTNLDFRMERGTLTISYDWWEEKKFSVQGNIRQGNASVFFPGDAAFHLLAKVVHGTISNDFNELRIAKDSPPNREKVEQLVNGGTRATIKLHVRKGDIKIVEANR